MKVRSLALLSAAFTVFSLAPCAVTAAEENHVYQGTGGYHMTFAVVRGGSYEMYIDARNPAGITQTRGGCSFGGSFARADGSTIAAFGNGVRVGPLHFRFDRTYNLPAGRYTLDIAPASDCLWKFILGSLNNGPAGPAGLAPLRMLAEAPGPRHPATTAAIGDAVYFLAQYRTGSDAAAAVSGTMQFVHDGAVLASFPVQVTTDPDSGAPVVGIRYTFDTADTKFIGKNTARVNVTIGGKKFSSSTDFTLTR